MIQESDVTKYLKDEFEGVRASTSDVDSIYGDYVQYEFASYVMNYVEPHTGKNKTFLDIGSGYGSFVYLLRKKGYKAFGIEIADFPTRYARQRLQEELRYSQEESTSICLKETALALPFSDASFDIVTMWNVLEHIQDYKTALQEACRVLKSGGKLFILNVNYASCFVEPHYRIPWLPFLPKRIAYAYLSLLSRDPDYLRNNIFYVHNWGILKVLRDEGMKIKSARGVRLSKVSPNIISEYKRLIWNFLRIMKLTFVIGWILNISLYNPFCACTNLVATKE